MRFVFARNSLNCLIRVLNQGAIESSSNCFYDSTTTLWRLRSQFLFFVVKISSFFQAIEPCEWKRSWSAGDCCWRQPGGEGGGGRGGGEGGGQVCQGTASTCNLATGNACQTWVAQPALSRFLVAVCVDQPRSEQPEYWYYIKASRAHI